MNCVAAKPRGLGGQRKAASLICMGAPIFAGAVITAAGCPTARHRATVLGSRGVTPASYQWNPRLISRQCMCTDTVPILTLRSPRCRRRTTSPCRARSRRSHQTRASHVRLVPLSHAGCAPATRFTSTVCTSRKHDSSPILYGRCRGKRLLSRSEAASVRRAASRTEVVASRTWGYVSELV